MLRIPIARMLVEPSVRRIVATIHRIPTPANPRESNCAEDLLETQESSRIYSSWNHPEALEGHDVRKTLFRKFPLFELLNEVHSLRSLLQEKIANASLRKQPPLIRSYPLNAAANGFLLSKSRAPFERHRELEGSRLEGPQSMSAIEAEERGRFEVAA